MFGLSLVVMNSSLVEVTSSKTFLHKTSAYSNSSLMTVIHCEYMSYMHNLFMTKQYLVGLH
jgi:hypothetical protein